MLDAPIGDDELDRLKALLDYEVLDTEFEIMYDEITKIASTICKTPIALISLIDKDRQWFKSKVGLGANETPRNISFCGHAIHQNDVFIIEDAFNDPRFKDNPLVTGAPHVTFYAGAPLTTPSGHNIGTLCVIDSSPRKLTEEQIDCLKIFSKLVVSYLEMKKQNSQIKILNHEIQSCALKIQLSTKELVMTSKFASLGEMAAGIAHEINNPLTIIIGKSNIIINRIKNKKIDEEKIILDLDKINKSAHRAAEIVKGLMSFSDNRDLDPFYHSNLLEIVHKSIDIIKDKNNLNGIKINIDISSKIELECRTTKICKCFVNLISNSLDAISLLNEKWIHIEAKEENSIIEIKITDSGNGLLYSEIQDHLMEPFFTTKLVGKGVGLGLAIVKGIIASHKGEFFYNQENKNTQFILKLPKTTNKLEKDDINN